MQSQMMSQQAHHMDQYHQMQMPPQQLPQDPQYNMWQQQDPANQIYNMNNTMIDPQMNYGVYDGQQQMQPPTMSQPNLHYQQSPQVITSYSVFCCCSFFPLVIYLPLNLK